MFDDSTTGTLQWKSLNYHVATGKYDGKNFAALPTLTVRLDPSAGTWDVFSGSRMIADNLPLIDGKKNDRRIIVTAGTEGAWVSGLVLADENPIYEDANANGIDDRFEIAQRGVLLPASASKPERQLLAQQGRDFAAGEAATGVFRATLRRGHEDGNVTAEGLDLQLRPGWAPFVDTLMRGTAKMAAHRFLFRPLFGSMFR